MTLEEYTNLNKDNSFCYWVEIKTSDIGSIQGASSFKFGVYERHTTDKEYASERYDSDGKYAWLTKYGNNAQEAFRSVKRFIIATIKAAQGNSLEAIDAIDLHNMFKWKIAFLYFDHEVISIFKKSALKKVAKQKGLTSAENKQVSELHQYLKCQQPEGMLFYDYADELWSEYQQGIEETAVHEKRTEYEESDEKEFSAAEDVGQLPSKIKEKLNQIFFGPPGTGKTYHTVNYALRIVEPEFYQKNKDNRDALVKRFRELLITDWDNPKQGRIAATTFHQSFTYEDFIEGIKPVLVTDEEDEESSIEGEGSQGEDTSSSESRIQYTIEDGIFKRISERARQDSGGAVGAAKGKLKWDRERFARAEFYKISLGDVNMPEDEEIYKYCLENDRIAIGFLNNIDLTDKSGPEIRQICENDPETNKYDCHAMSYFVHNLKDGYYVIIPNGNHRFRAIGKVKGDYEYDPPSPIRFNHFKEVEWLVTDEDLPVDLIYEKNFSQRMIYHLAKKFLKPEFFIKTQASAANKKSYVLIIDEINRGNIAQIFGELITLIEEDKREGKPEELAVSLPYSKKPFSVPSNLYLIGTMNTADRSVEALDTALRRRFQFQEEPPRPKIIAAEGASDDGYIYM